MCMETPKHISDRIKWDHRRNKAYGDPVYPAGIKYNPQSCEYCRETVVDPRVKITRYPEFQGVFLNRCLNCKWVQNPISKQFDLDPKTTPQKILKIIQDDK